ncbi:MAG: alpha/beta hydrolase [Dehalococcoidia bacterium]|nr:alpha/beta hydrolase [Dehalococcoidia bacterium]
MLKNLIGAAAALAMPPLALTVVSERIIRPRVLYTGPWNPEPPSAAAATYEEARFVTADGLELQGWYFPAPAQPAPTLLFMHGTSYNASDLWVTPDRAQAFREFLRDIGCNFFVFDYRGYGCNRGTPTEEGTYTDAAAALAWLYQRPDFDARRIFFYGFSLGTGIAAELAMREPSAGLLLRSPFTSIRGMIIDWYPKARYLLDVVPWLPLTNYDTLAKVRRLDRPLLVMHGDADQTVPYHMGREVFDAAPQPKTFVQFPETGHKDIANHLVVPAIRSFVRSVLGDAAFAARADAAPDAGAQASKPLADAAG